MMNKKKFRLLIITIIITGVSLRILWAYFTPSWQAPDEYPHFYVIKQLSITNKYPLSKPYFPFYESYQPPMYYFLSAYLVYSHVKKLDISSDDFENVLNEKKHQKNYALIFLRLFSVLISIISLLLMYWLLSIYFQNNRFAIVLSLSFFCFLPTFVNNGSTVNNDALANLFGLLVIFIIVRLPISYKKILALSVSYSAGIMTKTNILPLIFFILLVLFTEDIKKRDKIVYIFLFLLTTAICCLGYILWNFSRYNTFFPLNPGLLRTSPMENLTVANILRAIRNFNWSFWAAAGRIYEIHFPPYVYLFLYLPFSFLSLCGITKIFWKNISSNACSIFINKENRLRTILLLSIIIEVAASFYYTFSYPTFCSWGKYVYPILPSISILFTEGILNTFKKNITYIFSIVFIAILILSNLWLFFNVVN